MQRAAVYDAMTDLYALLPLGRKGKPLLKKRREATAPRRPGLIGAALERAVDMFAARMGRGAGRGRK